MQDRSTVRDEGAMLVPTVLAGLAVTASVLMVMVPWLGDDIGRHRAQHAADAAALAGVGGGRRASERLAAANAAVVVEWRRDGAVVTVGVVRGGHTASASATDGP